MAPRSNSANKPVDEQFKSWRKAGGHLPAIMKDFHRQKEIFAAVHELVEFDPKDIGGDINPVEAHCYVMDRFLWFMARHGYTLQKSRSKQNFDSLEDNLRTLSQERLALFAQAIGIAPRTQASED